MNGIIAIILGIFILIPAMCLAEGFKHPPAQSDLTPRTKYVDMHVGAALPTPGSPKVRDKDDALLISLGRLNEKMDLIIDLLGRNNAIH